jgi:hypothetical protein
MWIGNLLLSVNRTMPELVSMEVEGLNASAHRVRTHRLLAADLLSASPWLKETRDTSWRLWRLRH